MPTVKPGVIWAKPEVRLTTACEHCGFGSYEGQLGTARAHVIENPTHRVDMIAVYKTTLRMPGRRIRDGDKGQAGMGSDTPERADAPSAVAFSAGRSL